MTVTYQIHLPELHAAQQQIVDNASRYNVVNCGRRFGKNVLGEDRLIETAIFGKPAGWFSPTYKMLAESWRSVRDTVRPITTRANASEHRIELMTGGTVEMWSLDNPDAARGRKYARIVIDEAAMVPDLMAAWNAVLSPTLMDLHGDAWFASTPRGRNGFWQMWQWGQDAQRPEWMSWRFPTSANPFIAAGEIEVQRRERPERIFAQEIMAEFLDDAGGVFRRVREAATAETRDSGSPSEQYVIGVDWAKYQDFTVFVVGELRHKQIVHVDRFNQIDYRVQRQRLMALAERFRPTVILAESNSIGEPNIEDLQAARLPVRGFTTTNETKAQVIEDLTPAFESGSVRIPNDETLIGELQAYEMERLPSGRIRYNAPAGMHDDTVIATALCWHAMTRLSQRIRVYDY